MTKTIDATTAFLDSSKINFMHSECSLSSYPYIDFTFEEGTLLSEATVTHNVDDGGWHAQIHVAESEDADYEENHEASDEQLEALKAKLPDNTEELIAAFKTKYGPDVPTM